MDELLLKAIVDEDIGTIANIIQVAIEYEGTLYDRLSKAYYEITNKGGNPDDIIGLR